MTPDMNARKASAAQAAALQREAVQALTAGDMGKGIGLLEKAAALNPFEGGIQSDLGTAYWQAGQPEKAEQHYMKATKVAPDSYFAFNNYGAFLLEQRRYAEAEPLLHRALQLNPNHFETHNNIGMLAYRGGDLRAAEKHLLRSIRLNPGWANAYGNLGDVFLEQRRYADAEKAYHAALQRNPRNQAFWINLGKFYDGMNRDEDAERCVRKAIEIDDTQDLPWISLLRLTERRNRLDELPALLEEVKKRCPGRPVVAIEEAKFLRRQKKYDEAIRVLEGARAGITDKRLREHPLYIEMLSELGQFYDLTGQADNAFACFKEANDQQARGKEAQQYDKTIYPRVVARLTRDFGTELFGKGEPAPELEPGQATPVFLVGFPRSGTTLLDQILTSHPDIYVAEEKPALYEMVREFSKRHCKNAERLDKGDFDPCYPAALQDLTAEEIRDLRRAFFRFHEALPEGRRIFVDKLPLNIIHAGFVKRIFPEAKFILALRHPCDSVLSCYMQYFKLNPGMMPYLHLKDAAEFYDGVFTLWDHYVKTVPGLEHHAIRYEDVVADFRPAVSGLLGFLGVEWTDRVLEYDKTARERKVIHTPSYRQVTEKLYTRASGRWLRYRKHLAPVLDLLRPHAEKFGYAMEDEEQQKTA